MEIGCDKIVFKTMAYECGLNWTGFVNK